MKKLLLLITAIAFIQCFSYSQTNVKILDISVSPVLKIDTITGQPINSNEILNVVFKVKNIDQADKVNILFGTAQDVGDVLNVQADVIENSGTYYISYNGFQNAVNSYVAQTEIQLTPQQATDYAFITLYIEDTSSQETTRLYFIK